MRPGPRYRRVCDADFDAELRRAVYKDRLLPPDCPRKGDRAAVVKDHHARDTGLEVRVVGDPHYATIYCNDCGQPVEDWIVEVVPDPPHENYPPARGPYYMPIGWMRRILPLSIAARRT